MPDSGAIYTATLPESTHALTVGLLLVLFISFVSEPCQPSCRRLALSRASIRGSCYRPAFSTPSGKGGCGRCRGIDLPCFGRFKAGWLLNGMDSQARPVRRHWPSISSHGWACPWHPVRHMVACASLMAGCMPLSRRVSRSEETRPCGLKLTL